MKQLSLVFNKLFLAALLLLPTVFTACSDDEEAINAPQIVELNMPNDTIVSKGASFKIEPTLNVLHPAVYTWTVNGIEVSAESSYTFTATQAGKQEVVFKASNAAGEDQIKVTINVRTYYGGFYMINEGWFGNDKGSVCYYKDGEWTNNVFLANNADYSLGNTSTTGIIAYNKMYITSKEAPYLVEVDLNTYKQSSSIGSASTLSGQAYNFRAANENMGVLTTSTGAYKVSLNPLALGAKLGETTGKSGDIGRSKDYIFVIDNNIRVYKASDLSFVKNLFEENLTGAITGFAQTPDGTLWAATGSNLIKINATTLTAETIAMPESYAVNIISGGWSPSGLCASTTDNALYFIQKGGWSPKKAYRYDVESQNVTLIISVADKYFFYGAGLAVNPKTGNVYGIINYNYSPTNQVVVSDGKSEVPLETIDYSGTYWFPSTITFD